MIAMDSDIDADDPDFMEEAEIQSDIESSSSTEAAGQIGQNSAEDQGDAPAATATATMTATATTTSTEADYYPGTGGKATSAV